MPHNQVLGLAFKGPYAAIGQAARRAERSGFATFWVSDSAQDSLIQASVAIQATERIDVGTSITLAFPRSPTATAMQAWDLNDLGGERFILGLGSQVRRIIEDRYGAAFDRPALRMEEYVQAMNAVWQMERGEHATFEGDIYRVTRPGLSGMGDAVHRDLPRVYIAAVGPLMTKAAARYADGILGHPFTSLPYLTEHVLPRIEKDLQESGRSRSDFSVCQGVITSISDDRSQAIREAKLQIAFYGTTPNYRAVFDSAGDSGLTEILRDVWKRSAGEDLDALVAAVPDDAVHKYALAGTAEDVADQLQSYIGHADQVILGSTWFRTRPERVAENIERIIEVFGTAS